mmetsp:Transcript_20842/g.49487  ORF Transcript_20842/g.49487 Transcript_20842/m.49487 type:complete len:442 (+) Transcript_20842:763-2088(+)
MMMMKAPKTAPSLLLVVSTMMMMMAVVQAQDTNCSSITEIACETEGFETLCELVGLARLDDALDSGTWTVFAPTNEAFDALGDDVISSLENNTGTFVSFRFSVRFDFDASNLGKRHGNNDSRRGREQNQHVTALIPNESHRSELGLPLFPPLPPSFIGIVSRIVSLDALVNILTYHAVVDEVLLSTDLNCTGPVAMANGKNSRTVCVGDDIFQKGIGNPRTDMPQILAVDITSCNGVVHVVSEVMLPFVVEVMPSEMPVASPPVTDPPVDVPVETPSSSFPSDLPSLSPSVSGDDACATISRIACETDATSTLCELIQQYGLDAALSEGLWTVFAPTNDAFSAVSSVIPTLTPDQITDILLFHAVPEEELLSSDLECSQLVTMANDDTSRTVCMDDMIYQRGPGNNQEGSTRSMWPEIIAADISACNGVIHLVSNVLLPVL